mmetsp:Transcript_12495/g.13709  ORF Transcript_12495/g.13709 Transcript_12495/m.13709 type:complete len:440 (+) Transcript_12495:67-1386(+)
MMAPKKYIKMDGKMMMNPAYKAWKNQEEGNLNSANPRINPKALPVVSNMDDYMQLNTDLNTTVPMAKSAEATIELMQEGELSMAVGMQPDEMVDELGGILGKYEVPMGLMNKLLVLSEYASLEFIIDDSGSMRLNSDTINPITKQPNTRWEEAHERLKEMVEILAFVPFNQIGIVFLNRKDHVTLERNGQPPRDFLSTAYAQIDAVFRTGPRGTTPALEKLKESLERGKGACVARYFFGDGLPNGGQHAIKEICHVITNRANPAQNPITFLSCTGEDEQVEWMKDCEEVAPYCAESDDFGDESREVLGDQGIALPYTRGFWLVCQLVAAMNPDDLDAMDESVPFTKTTLDNLLGIQHNEASYKHYFDSFVHNQKTAHRGMSKSARLKRNTKWKYQDFVTAPVAKEIPQVQKFTRQMAKMHTLPEASTSTSLWTKHLGFK